MLSKHGLEMFQRASCALIIIKKTSDLLSKGVNMINITNLISETEIVQNLKHIFFVSFLLLFKT